MDSLGSSPFAVLTFIAAPAILTNASCVLTLSTSNRFARAIDRTRTLAGLLQSHQQENVREPWLSENVRLEVKQLHLAERRVLLLVRALTAFYWSMGSFALGALTSLLGASLNVSGYQGGTQVVLFLAFAAGVSGVGGLVIGASLLVLETRVTLRLLREETGAIRTFADGRLKRWEAESAKSPEAASAV